MKAFLIAVALMAGVPGIALTAMTTPAEAHRVCNEWGQCWWHPDFDVDWDWGHRRHHHEGWGGEEGGEHHGWGGHEGGEHHGGWGGHEGHDHHGEGHHH
jgi:hypothetical protein